MNVYERPNFNEVPHGQKGLKWLINHREEIFPWTAQEIYFNNAAYAPANTFSIQAGIDYLIRHAHEGSEFYKAHQQTIQETRDAVAELLNCDSEEIGFSLNTTEAINRIALGMEWERGDEIIVLDPGHEYPSNYLPWVEAAKSNEAEIILLQGDKNGFVKPEEIKNKLTPETRMVTASSVGFKSGQRINLEEIGRIIENHNLSPLNKKPVRFHVDAVQQLGMSEIDVRKSKIDYLSSGAQKWMLADNGVAIIFAARKALKDLKCLPRGAYSEKQWWNPESGMKDNASIFEIGTNNGEGIWRLKTAIDLINRIGIKNIESRIFNLTTRLCKKLNNKGYIVYSPRRKKTETSGIVMVSKPEWENKLSSCSSLKDINELGEKFDEEMTEVKKPIDKKPIIFTVRGGRMRIGIHYYNTEDEIDELIERLPDLSESRKSRNKSKL